MSWKKYETIMGIEGPLYLTNELHLARTSSSTPWRQKDSVRVRVHANPFERIDRIELERRRHGIYDAEIFIDFKPPYTSVSGHSAPKSVEPFLSHQQNELLLIAQSPFFHRALMQLGLQHPEFADDIDYCMLSINSVPALETD